jgi:hypothetical protein
MRFFLNADNGANATVGAGVVSEVVSGREVDGAIRIPTVGKAKSAPKLKKDGTPRKARVVTGDAEFLASYKETQESGGTISMLADKIGAEYGSVIQRIKSINEQLLDAGLPELPELTRASGPRKDKASLLALVAATFAPIGKGELQSLDVNAPISGVAPQMTEAEAQSDA